MSQCEYCKTNPLRPFKVCKLHRINTYSGTLCVLSFDGVDNKLECPVYKKFAKKEKIKEILK